MKFSLSVSQISGAVFALGTVIGVFGAETADAIILVEPIVTTANQDILKTRNPRTLVPEIEPGQVIRYGVPDSANNLLNGTKRDIGSLVFDLETLAYTNSDSTPPFNQEEVQWGDVNGDGKIGFSTIPGLEDIFDDISVTGNRIIFAGGKIPKGKIFYNRFFSTPNLAPGGGIIPPAPPAPADQDGPIRVASFYTKAIPEANSIFALFATMAAMFVIKGKSKNMNKSKLQK
ncbi:hypothetical protein [Calothrix sp. PCC 6303]|uniref:hypothetical protein n=1 Tax=Calothrix sp. PCC 6303 TaxID=1170562 RepID=UPI0002A00B70|nr:hypothetical protein [Calothrix sp. PCC 6303]AFZ00959.1 hypothetical protein Cal6303_1925 [Calothrix sp. PCC 6303]